jgi:hypothetical protein
MHRPTATESGVSTKARTKTTTSRAPGGGSNSARSPARTAWARQPALEQAARCEPVRDHARQRRHRLREQQARSFH